MTTLHLPGRGRRALLAGLAFVLAVAGGLVATPGVASAASLASFSAGVFEPGQVRHIWWNNANWDAYAPGLEATGVDDPDAVCHVKVKRTWYQRNTSGEREFHLEIEGDTSDRCRVTVWLARLTMYRHSITSTLEPGESWSAHWNNAHTDQNVYVVGVLPAQVDSGACAIEVTTAFRTQPDGENEFSYRAVNVGGVACSAQLLHVKLPVNDSHALNPLNPGNGWGIRTAAPPAGTRVQVAGAAPTRVATGPCDITPDQEVGYSGSANFWVDFTNTGTVKCGLTVTFAWL
ncbi:hypothetical protein [Catellatospora vulcania]|uniref:hypothetical protein n=1 Tax=Catellatospora vulcania TaxID=1460450 RepID=UPI0012D45200|nr:hypothetical protein [Catellatospora vulcania]